jgi:hypothetical protein
VVEYPPNHRGFLPTLWRGGAQCGDTDEDAYFVHCDGTTMT